MRIDFESLQKELRDRDIRLRQAAQRWRRYRIKYRTVEALKKRVSWASFRFPVIRNMPEGNLMEQLVAVQPMAGPAPQMLYMDLRVGRDGVRYRRRRRVREEFPRLLRAGQLDGVYENENDEHQEAPAGGTAYANRHEAFFAALIGSAAVRPRIAAA